MNNKLDHINIAAVVILYNSENIVVKNIKSYIDKIDILYVVDNSYQPNKVLIDQLSQYKKVHYHSMCGNKGIAVALNWAAQSAIEKGYKALLSMDDDTEAPFGMIENMLAFWNNYEAKIGIVAGVFHDKSLVYNYKETLYTYTSSSLLNLEAYKKVGGFMDDLFIDHIDHEYGMRLNKYGYNIIELSNVRLRHQLGYQRIFDIKFAKIKYTTHSPFRLYFYIRNGIFISKIYFKYYPKFTFDLMKYIVKILLKSVLLDENKIPRINAVLLGFKDGIKNNLVNSYKSKLSR